MREQWMDRFTARISDFEEKLEAFNKGEIDRKAYKGFSGGFGSYAQRDPAKNMLRLRLPGGRMTKPWLYCRDGGTIWHRSPEADDL